MGEILPPLEGRKEYEHDGHENTPFTVDGVDFPVYTDPTFSAEGELRASCIRHAIDGTIQRLESDFLSNEAVSPKADGPQLIRYARICEGMQGMLCGFHCIQVDIEGDKLN